MIAHKKLVIVGAGAMGREAALYAQDMIDAGTPGLSFAGIAGFLDDAPTAADRLGELGVAFDFVEPIDPHPPRRDCVYTLAVGQPKTRQSLWNRLASVIEWANIVHPSAYVAKSARLGAGVIIAPFAFIGTDASVDDQVLVNIHASIGHDSRVGRCSVLSPYAAVNGNVVLGERVFLGTHATVIPGRTVGSDSSLAAGAVVVRDVRPGSFLMGNPAKGWQMYEAQGNASRER